MLASRAWCASLQCLVCRRESVYAEEARDGDSEASVKAIMMKLLALACVRRRTTCVRRTVTQAARAHGPRSTHCQRDSDEADADEREQAAAFPAGSGQG